MTYDFDHPVEVTSIQTDAGAQRRFTIHTCDSVQTQIHYCFDSVQPKSAVWLPYSSLDDSRVETKNENSGLIPTRAFGNARSSSRRSMARSRPMQQSWISDSFHYMTICQIPHDNWPAISAVHDQYSGHAASLAQLVTPISTDAQFFPPLISPTHRPFSLSVVHIALFPLTLALAYLEWVLDALESPCIVCLSNIPDPCLSRQAASVTTHFIQSCLDQF